MNEATMKDLLTDCSLCPRRCHVNRLSGQTGYCGQTGEIKAARAGLHLWEEPCISGRTGSGTVFFSGCSLKCVFCQNHDIALGRAGREISAERLSEIFLELKARGACNINLVTPTHFVPQICTALRRARTKGLDIPVVYNTGSYEWASTLRLLEGLVDIYLPDLKYFSPALSQRYAQAPDYFSCASEAIAEMYRQAGDPVFDPDTGMMKRGVIVRHLILPGQTGDSKKILRYLHNTYGNHILVSIMNQYTPLMPAGQFPELDRKLSDQEYQRVLKFALEIGIENGFLQEGETAGESFIPPFDGEGL